METFVRVIFILPSKYNNEFETSQEMQQSYEACKQNSIDVEWCNENDCTDLKLKKNDVIVFESFEGDSFTKVQEAKSVRIVGPWCLLTCLVKGIPIPNVTWPVYSMAMNNCIITFSSLGKPEKKNLHEKVQFMGGICTPDLSKSNTHLVTDSVNSLKYIKAAEGDIKIMLPTWVDAVWKACQGSNAHSADKQFDQYQCPVLHKLTISCTGFNLHKQLEIKNLVNNNGGKFNDQLYARRTDFLICDGGKNSAKWQAAKKYKIKCVTMKWLTESINSGYALSDNNYLIGIATSTPTKDDSIAEPFSMAISTIENNSIAQASNFLSTIDETQISKYSNFTNQATSNTLKRKRLFDDNEYVDLLDKIDIKQVKMIGPFLDGCGVFAVGFNAEQREKLSKILNLSGATRYSEISSRVTHILVGDVTSNEVRRLATKLINIGCPVVKIGWLIDSLKNKQPADEINYIVNTATLLDEPSSPLSKKGLHLLRTPNRDVGVELSPAENRDNMEQEQLYHQPVTDHEDTLVNLLNGMSDFSSKKENSNKAPALSTTKLRTRISDEEKLTPRPNSLSSAVDDSSSSSHLLPIFSGLKFIVSGFTDTQQQTLTSFIQDMAGKVVSKFYKGIADYIVVPLFNYELIKQVATEIVNDLWITECLQEKELKEVQYFHRPMSLKEGANPLKDCVITISTYPNYERTFLKSLIIQLGGTYQEQFSRIECSINNVKTSTHLISPEASGKKYLAAIKWNLPVINKDWLLECARISSFIDPQPYLIGESKCSKTSTPGKSSEFKPCQSRNLVSRNLIDVTKSGDLNLSAIRTPLTQKKLMHSNNDESESISKTSLSPPQLYNTPPVDSRLNQSSSIATPINKHLKNVQNTPFYSQVTPVKDIMATAREKNLLGTPDTSIQIPKSWDHVDTPETPLGAFIRDNPSPNLRKQMVRFLNTLPEYKPRRDSTPLSELKRQLWEKICPSKSNIEQPDFDAADDEAEDQVITPTEKKKSPFIENQDPQSSDNKSNEQLDNHFKRLQDLMTSSGGNRTVFRRSIEPVAGMALKYSQPNTVGWDDDMETGDPVEPAASASAVTKKYNFLITGIEKDRREQISLQLENIGATVLTSPNFDPDCTHVICLKFSRNEKILAGMASGKWILHISYIDKCISEGKLVDEEPFEFGNPKSADNEFMTAFQKDNEAVVACAYYWRKEIAKRGYGIFHDMRAIVVSQKRATLIRILKAGGGIVIDASPPFTDTIHATHCLIDSKLIKDVQNYMPLVEQGIYCIIAMYINDVIYRKMNDVKQYIIPDLEEHYD